MLFLAGLGIVSLIGLGFLPPIAQDPLYHAFADQRALLGVPHFWNVVSNLPFVLHRRRRAHALSRRRPPSCCFSAFS